MVIKRRFIQAPLPLAWPKCWLELIDYNMFATTWAKTEPAWSTHTSFFVYCILTYIPSPSMKQPRPWLSTHISGLQNIHTTVSDPISQPVLTNLTLPHSEPSLCRASPVSPGHPGLSRWVQNRLFSAHVSLKLPHLTRQIVIPSIPWIAIKEAKVITFLVHVLLAIYKAFHPHPWPKLMWTVSQTHLVAVSFSWVRQTSILLQTICRLPQCEWC